MTYMNCSDFYTNNNVNFDNIFLKYTEAAKICRGYNLENEYQVFFAVTQP